jgi:hypothetical protein
MLLRFSGLLRVLEYRRVRITTEGGSEHLFLYEFEGEEDFRRYESSSELKRARDEMYARWGTPPAGFEILRREQYEYEGTWQRRS